jgi:hypothetical protein
MYRTSSEVFQYFGFNLLSEWEYADLIRRTGRGALRTHG